MPGDQSAEGHKIAEGWKVAQGSQVARIPHGSRIAPGLGPYTRMWNAGMRVERNLGCLPMQVNHPLFSAAVLGIVSLAHGPGAE